MYDFAVENCLYHSTCKKNVSIGIFANIENQKMFHPTNYVSTKLLFELKLGFENIEIYTL